MKIALLFGLVLSLILSTGCNTVRVKERVSTSAIGGYIMPQTHYTYPNSNVIPIGPVKGRARARGDLESFPDINGTIKRAIDKAVQSSDSDLLINALVGGTLTSYTKMDGNNFKVRYELEIQVQGTAAKMEIGRQNLR